MDASQRGIAAVLLQTKGSEEFASKLLSEAESRYSNIEREMLAVLFGLEKFHYYAYGRPDVVESDHKTLEAIFKKHLSSAPPRLWRMLLRIQGRIYLLLMLSQGSAPALVKLYKD